MTLRFSRSDLLRQFGSAEVHKGEVVLRSGAVGRVDVSHDGLSLSASVAGSRPRPYSQTIRLSPQGSQVLIKGYCTCPVGTNCKHVAAVLLRCLPRQGNDPGVRRPAAGLPELNRPYAAVVRGAPKQVAAVTGQPRRSLSGQVSGWLDRLAAAVAPAERPAAAAGSIQRLVLYVLNYRDAAGGHGTSHAYVRPVSVRVRKDGSVTDAKYYDPGNAARPREQWARFVTDTDHALLRGLAWRKRESENIDRPDIAFGTDPTSRSIFQALIDSGRLRYGEPEGPVLQNGPAIRAEPRWIKTERGEQQLNFVPVGGAERFTCVLPFCPPLYVDFAAGRIGAIETALAPQVALEIARAPVIAISEAVAVKDMMQRRLGVTAAPEMQAAPVSAAGPVLPLPEAPANVETRMVAPTPRLALFTAPARNKPSFGWYTPGISRPSFALPLARLSFDYAGEIVPHASKLELLERVEGDKLIVTPRDPRSEAEAAQRLADFGMVGVAGMPFDVSPEHAGDLVIAPQDDDDIWDDPDFDDEFDESEETDDAGRYIAFSLDAVPQLLQDGWVVTFSDDYPYRMAEGDVRWWADIGEGSGIDWGSFELGVEFEGVRIDLVPHLVSMLTSLPPGVLGFALSDGGDALVAALCRQQKLMHRLPDGRLLPLPAARLAPMLMALMELIGPRGQRMVGGKVRLHRAEAGALAAFAGAAGADVAWAANARRLIELGNRLRSGRGLASVAVPASFQGRLRPYQGDGLAWLDFLRDAGFGGVLADDMGLGKTVQALAFLTHEKEAGRLDRPALIVCPTSVLPNWQDEAARFAPALKVLSLRGLERKESFGAIPGSDIVLTTYPLLARDHEVLLAQEYHAAILDEAQAIKNPKAIVSRLAHGIKARHRLALTGTPLENNLGEVWSLFAFLAPGLLGDETTFRRTFRIPIEKHGDGQAQAFLSGRLKPFMLRRTKEDVAKELPPKTEIVERIRLDGAQRDLYETVRALMHAKVRDEIASKGLAKSHIVFLDALLKLRQVCCDPRLLRLPQAKAVKGSAKLERLMEMIPELVGEGRHILLFSQFTSMLALIEEELARLKIPYVMLTGDTKDRATPVRQFQAGKVPLFLVSLKAGGTGLNLTAADTVIHYDPWWNPAVENQATDRAHRIGQDKPVFVYKLIVEEGIEAAIEVLKARKAALAEALFAGGAKTPLDLTEADISALFAPLDRRTDRRAA